MTTQSAIIRFESPIGWLTLSANDAHLLGVKISKQGASGTRGGEFSHPILTAAMDQITAWFAGTRRDFDLPLAPLDSAEGEALRAGIAAIPYGETMTYGTLGSSIGSAARAVGQACKTNPYPLIIPCHRVVSTAGPEYYSGGDGPRTKTWLIDFEYANLPADKRTRLI